jgi:hypothetical protein
MTVQLQWTLMFRNENGKCARHYIAQKISKCFVRIFMAALCTAFSKSQNEADKKNIYILAT